MDELKRHKFRYGIKQQINNKKILDNWCIYETVDYLVIDIRKYMFDIFVNQMVLGTVYLLKLICWYSRGVWIPIC